MLRHSGLAGQEKTTAPRAPRECGFHSQTKQSRALPATPSFIWPSLYPSALIIPGPDTRQMPTASMPQSLPELFEPANPKPVQLLTLPPSFLSAKTTIKALAQALPSLLPPPVGLMLPCVALCGLACSLLLGTVSNKRSFWASPYPRESKILGTF